MDFRNFTTHAAEHRRAGAIFRTPPPVDGKRTGVHHCNHEVKKIIINSFCTTNFWKFLVLLRGPGGGGLHQNSLEIDFIVVSGRRE